VLERYGGIERSRQLPLASFVTHSLLACRDDAVRSIFEAF
jgi:hypothetical protein